MNNFDRILVSPFAVEVDSHPWGVDFPDHPMEYFFRVTSTYFFSSDGGCHPSMGFERWKLIRHTPKGVWVIPEWLDYPVRHTWQQRQVDQYKKLVLHGARRKWAHPTKAEAWQSFLIRQDRRVSHCRNALQAAEAIRAAALEFNAEKLSEANHAV